MRDSLLHAGDQLSIQVSPDDEETALRVILVRGGSASDRAAAERPVQEAAIREPRTEDLSKPRTVSIADGTREASHESGPDPVEESKAPAEGAPATSASSSSGPEPEAAPESNGPRATTDAGIIAEARSASANFTATLPNYLVQQVTVRYFSPTSPARWQLLDQVTADLAYVDGKEDYRNFRIDGKPIDRPEQSGSWSTGEFSTTLEDLLSPTTSANFRRRGEEKLNGRIAIVFNYTVAQSNSHWIIVSPDQRRYSPAYEGSIWVDKDTRRVLRTEQRTTAFPRDWPFKMAESILEYGYVKIDQKTYLLPNTAENVGCMSGSGACTRNLIEFRNYRKFTAESNVRFEK